MKLPHIIRKVYSQPWCIDPVVHRSIQRALEAHLEGLTAQIPMPESEIPEDERMEMYGDNGLCVVPIHGIIGKHLSGLEMACGGCSLDSVSAMLEDAVKDPECKAILLDINSPGGTVTGVPELADEIAEANKIKPVIAFTDAECCSAAYWLASQASAIYATPSSSVGSIGVYIALLDESRALENAGVKVNAIHAGKWKLAGAPFKPLTDEERKMFQDSVDKTHAQFKSAVSRGRNISEDSMQGQCFDGDEALTAGLIDGHFTNIAGAIEAALALTK